MVSAGGGQRCVKHIEWPSRLTVQAAADQLGVVKLQRADASGMATEGPDLLARLDVP